MSTASNQTVVVYTQPGCPSCNQVKAFLKARGVAFSERDVTRDDAALRDLQTRGYAATPLTLVGDVEVLGMNKARLEEVLPPRVNAPS